MISGVGPPREENPVETFALLLLLILLVWPPSACSRQRFPTTVFHFNALVHSVCTVADHGLSIPSLGGAPPVVGVLQPRLPLVSERLCSEWPLGDPAHRSPGLRRCACGCTDSSALPHLRGVWVASFSVRCSSERMPSSVARPNFSSPDFGHMTTGPSFPRLP